MYKDKDSRIFIFLL